MNFIATTEHYSQKLNNNTVVVNNLWKEIITGKPTEISADHIIEYSFHYPVDTEVYLEELLQKFEDSMKEDLRTIDGNLKAYLLTFIYYCMGATTRVPARTGLYAAELYMRIILVPSDIGKLYFEYNIYNRALLVANNFAKKQYPEPITIIVDLFYKYTLQEEIPSCVVEGSANLFANVIKYRIANNDGEHILVRICAKYLKELIIIKDNPVDLRVLVETMTRCLRTQPCAALNLDQRKLVVNECKAFIKNVILGEIEHKYKHQYIILALFHTLELDDFDLYEDCVDIVNMLSEELYKEVLRRISRNLASKNHEKSYENVMKLFYFMLMIPHPGNFSKLEVLMSVCFKDVLAHLLNRKRPLQDICITMTAKICLLQNNAMVDKIFQLASNASSFCTISPDSILIVMIKILDDQHAGNVVRNKNMLHIVSKMVISLEKFNGSLASQVLFLICKDGSPFNVKNFLRDLHELYLQLTDKLEKDVQCAILRIFFKMATHTDPSSSLFLQHLYKCVIFPSHLNGKDYGPECYSNSLLSNDFEHDLLFKKWREQIEYDHIRFTIANLNFRQPGHCVLLYSLLEFYNYKEYKILTDYIKDNFPQMISVEHVFQLLYAYSKILRNNTELDRTYFPKFHTIHQLLWSTLNNQRCCANLVKPIVALIDTLKGMLHMCDDLPQRRTLLTRATKFAYTSLVNHTHQGALMHLTEICIALRASPPDGTFAVFENLFNHPDSLNALVQNGKGPLIELLSFFGTIAMMDRRRIPLALKYFRVGLRTGIPLVQLTSVKIYYNFSSEMLHEFDEIIQFCLRKITSPHMMLTKTCIQLLEELIHDNYVLLNSEDFLRFVHRLGTKNLNEFMEQTLQKRFLLANKHDIGRFYMTTLVYLSGHTKFLNYPIAPNFMDELLTIRGIVDTPNDLFIFLFKTLHVKTQFNILREICYIFDSLVAGTCKADEAFFVCLRFTLYTFKIMCGKPGFEYDAKHYVQVCRSIEKQILSRDPRYNEPTTYGEYEAYVRQCTHSLFELFFFVKEEELLADYRFAIFDAVVCWIDHVMPELVQYKHYEQGDEFDLPLKKFVAYYKGNKHRLENALMGQESTTEAMNLD